MSINGAREIRMVDADAAVEVIGGAPGTRARDGEQKLSRDAPVDRWMVARVSEGEKELHVVAGAGFRASGADRARSSPRCAGYQPRPCRADCGPLAGILACCCGIHCCAVLAVALRQPEALH